jgi:hypothetical protein
MCVLVVSSSLESCLVDKPVADTSTERSASAKIFAVDCRAWVVSGRRIEAEASLVDFAEGSGDLEFRWSFDGVALPPSREPRPRVTNGRFIKYSLSRRISHEFSSLGTHQIAVAVANGERTGTCGMTVSVPAAE